jgi:hypothetical protein
VIGPTDCAHAGRETLLGRIERYYDAVPRRFARVEECGPFTLFLGEPGGWTYYGRQGLGAAVTAHLVEDAVSLGLRTVFLSASSPDVARVYAGIGFARIGTAYGARR